MKKILKYFEKIFLIKGTHLVDLSIYILSMFVFFVTFDCYPLLYLKQPALVVGQVNPGEEGGHVAKPWGTYLNSQSGRATQSRPVSLTDIPASPDSPHLSPALGATETQSHQSPSSPCTRRVRPSQTPQIYSLHPGGTYFPSNQLLPV